MGDGGAKKHELLAQLKNLASELGRTPYRDEGLKSGICKSQVDKVFGSWSIFVRAAGLESVRPNKKIDDRIFHKDISDHLEKYRHRGLGLLPRVRHTMIAGDTHFPFDNKPAIDRFIEHVEIKQPKVVIQIGDLYDMFSHGKFPRSQNIYTPKAEIEEGIKRAQSFWERIRKVAPDAELHQVVGNHDIRPIKRIIESYPEAEIFFEFERLFQFEGVQLHSDIREEVDIDGIKYLHGYRTKLGDHMEFMRKSCVVGHSHRGGVAYKNFFEGVLFELNAGYLGDPEAKALGYTSQRHTHWTTGYGELDIFGPRFIPL